MLSRRCIAARLCSASLPGAAVVTEGCLETGLEVGREVLLTEGCWNGPLAGVFAADVTDACLETGWDKGEFTVPLFIEICLDGTLPVSVWVTEVCLETGWDTGGIAAPLVIEVCLDGTLSAPCEATDACLETG